MLANFNANFRIRTRVQVGFGLVLLLLLGLAAFSELSLRDVRENVLDSSRISRATNSATRITASASGMRRAGEAFVRDGGEDNLKTALEQEAITVEAFAQAARFTRNPARLQMLKETDELFATFRQNFAKTVNLRKERDREINTNMRPVAIRVVTAMNEIVDASFKAGDYKLSALVGEAHSHLLLARFNVSSYLLNNDKKLSETADRELSAFTAALAPLVAMATGDIKSKIESILVEAPKYQEAFRNVSKVAQETHRLSADENARVANAMQAKLEELRSGQASVFEGRIESLEASIGTAMLTILIACCIAFGIGLGFAFIIARGIAGPVAAITSAMSSLAAGNLKTEVPAQSNKDEIGDMAKALLVFREAAVDRQRMEREAEEARVAAEAERIRSQEEAIAHERALVTESIGKGLASLAAKDLTYRLNDNLPAAYAKLQGDFNHAVEQLEVAMQAVMASSGAMSAGSGEISSAADDLSKRTEQQAASLEQTAAALDEITATGKKAAEGASHAREVVATAKGDAEKTGEVVRKTVDAIGAIERSANQISQIIGVIDEIAFQTNLLALNAGVEAARAGEAGRGFAVVASEVRALAQRSADAAKEIKGLISTSSTQVAEGVDLVAETGKALERILAQVNDINKVVIDIASGAQEQATGLAQVNTAINQMDQTTQQNASMVEQSTAASHNLAQEAGQLSDLVGQFRIAGAGAAVSKPAAPARRAPVARREMRTASSRSGSAAVAKQAEPAGESDWQDF